MPDTQHIEVELRQDLASARAVVSLDPNFPLSIRARGNSLGSRPLESLAFIDLTWRGRLAFRSPELAFALLPTGSTFQFQFRDIQGTGLVLDRPESPDIVLRSREQQDGWQDSRLSSIVSWRVAVGLGLAHIALIAFCFSAMLGHGPDDAVASLVLLTLSLYIVPAQFLLGVLIHRSATLVRIKLRSTAAFWAFAPIAVPWLLLMLTFSYD